MLALAVHAETPLATLRSMHYAYPTFHRAVESVLDDLVSRTTGRRGFRHFRHFRYC